jgi:hypothetical protein
MFKRAWQAGRLATRVADSAMLEMSCENDALNSLSFARRRPSVAAFAAEKNVFIPLAIHGVTLLNEAGNRSHLFFSFSSRI